MKLLLLSSIVLALAVAVGLWVTMRVNKDAIESNQTGSPAQPDRSLSKTREVSAHAHMAGGEDAAEASQRRSIQSHANSVESASVLAILASGEQTMDERVGQLQGMRGISLSTEERESALSFLSGKEIPEDMGKAAVQWLADELLTVMRLQDPPWDGLAEDLSEAAFQPGTDPVVRDYIMQHLGHLWEQSGFSKEIDAALWRAVASSDETTPGTALIALSRGYERDQQEQSLAKVRQQALELARNPETGLAVRVTALSIAGDGGGVEVQRLAGSLSQNPDTPVILKRAAERLVK